MSDFQSQYADVNGIRLRYAATGNSGFERHIQGLRSEY
jgi:hypothetical protein